MKSKLRFMGTEWGFTSCQTPGRTRRTNQEQKFNLQELGSISNHGVQRKKYLVGGVGYHESLHWPKKVAEGQVLLLINKPTETEVAYTAKKEVKP